MNMSLPTIKLGNLILREIIPDDYYDYYLIGKDIETVKHLNWGPFTNPNEALWVITNIFYKRPEMGLPIGYAIVMNGKMIGAIDYHTYNQMYNSIEIGYVLNKDYWGKGIMPRCLKAVIDVGFNYLGYSKIEVGHTVSNDQSRRVILKCGLKYEYSKMVQMKNEEYELGYFYSIYRHEYKGGLL